MKKNSRARFIHSAVQSIENKKVILGVPIREGDIASRNLYLPELKRFAWLEH